MVNKAVDKMTTVVEILNVHLRSCLIVGKAESISKIVDSLVFLLFVEGFFSVRAKTGKKACDKEDPTSPKVKHKLATANSAVCAAACGPPKEAAVAALDWWRPTLTLVTNRNGKNENNSLMVSITAVSPVVPSALVVMF